MHLHSETRRQHEKRDSCGHRNPVQVKTALKRIKSIWLEAWPGLPYPWICSDCFRPQGPLSIYSISISLLVFLLFVFCFFGGLSFYESLSSLSSLSVFFCPLFAISSLSLSISFSSHLAYLPTTFLLLSSSSSSSPHILAPYPHPSSLPPQSIGVGRCRHGDG